MRTIQHFCVASVLTLTITISAFAGVMQTPGAPAPDEQQTSSETVAGEMSTPSVTDDSLMEIALGFLLDVSSLV